VWIAVTHATIFAPSTAAGRAGIAVIRVSGPDAEGALAAMTRRAIPAPRRAVRARFHDPDTGEPLDHGLVLWFPGPASFTGEDTVELHVHGGRATVAAIMAALARLPGLRPAEPGEFTRRAFNNGKLDLTEVEGLADLVAADTEAQRRQALRQLGGALGILYDGWRNELLRALAWEEAAIDFADEGLPEDLEPEVRSICRRLVDQVRQHLDDGNRAERLRDGVQVAIVGPPNVGKSSLLNVLAGREAAIVAPAAGTTRDVIEVHLDLAGIAVIVADTAGLRHARDDVEAEGIRRALTRAEAADLRIVMFDGAAAIADTAAMRLLDNRSLAAFNKMDLAGARAPEFLKDQVVYPISVKTGAGLDTLLAEVTRRVTCLADPGPGPALTRARHRAALNDCLDALERVLAAPRVELAAEDLRLATRSLGRITGRVGVEDVLELVFREFCIGK
jgi:tRNA modification GTPase